MSQCSKCGCQVESPFDGSTVIHDVDACLGEICRAAYKQVLDADANDPDYFNSMRPQPSVLDISGEEYQPPPLEPGLGKYFPRLPLPTINQLSILPALMVAIVLLASATRSDAAQVVTGVQMGASPIALPALVIAPFKQTVLTWDNPPGASNRVAWGLARYQWTNSVTVATNRFNVTNGTHYAVTSLVSGVESEPALWPSNRIGEIWLTNLKTNIVRLERFTNAPPEAMRFWGVANITTGWE